MLVTLSLMVLAGLFAIGSLAAPIAEDKRGSSGVSADLLTTFNLMEQYAAAAYCPNNDNSPGDKITCVSGNCGLVQSANTTSLIEFSNTKDSTDVTGYVAVDHTNKVVVVAFRGSTSIQNWLTNFAFDFVNTDICSGCQAHHGFWQSWVDSRTNIMNAIKGCANSYPGYKLSVVGHSLGGAIATLAAAQLRNEGYQAALYSFGSPRIAGSKLSDYISNQPGGNYRITHWNDPVPRVPLLTMGYVHISPEYYINKVSLQSVSAPDLKIYTGSINLSGNAAWVATDIGSHLWYFNSIAQCAIDTFLS